MLYGTYVHALERHSSGKAQCCNECDQYEYTYSTSVLHCPLTRFTANSAPLKYTTVMVPLPPFPILLSTASREGRGRKDPASKAAILCGWGEGGKHTVDYTIHNVMKHLCIVNATLH